MLGLFQRSSTRYLETKDDRNALKADDNALSASLPDMSVTMGAGETEEELREMDEYKSVEAFVEFCMDDDRSTFTHIELLALCFNLQKSPQPLRSELKGWGLTLAVRPKERTVRGFTANSHNLYQGNPMAGGSGIENNGPGARFGR